MILKLIQKLCNRMKNHRVQAKQVGKIMYMPMYFAMFAVGSIVRDDAVVKEKEWKKELMEQMV